ncbi:MAG: hypothetical protein JWQ87_5454 [Candidatus Sulfotelmatobacter sp.]|nr:hypothetical protein [Candidatus Sulfotelmatobacter sp.]
MPSSSISIQLCVDDALRFGDIKPVLQAGGSSMEPALTIANIVMAEICSKQFNWPWNSFNVTPFCTNGWQNDYCSGGVQLPNGQWINNPCNLNNLGWIESGVIIDINSSSIPKRKFPLEVGGAMLPTSSSYGRPYQVAWMNNSNLLFGSWGSGVTVPNTNATGQLNPGPGTVYGNPVGVTVTPQNPITQIIDPNGNYQVLTRYGTCGGGPTWPAANAAVGTVTTDGSVQWTVADPYGQGFRLQPIEASGGVIWLVLLVGQTKPTRFTSLKQFINPIPDDFSQYFMQGFRTYCYQRAPEQKVRARFQEEYSLWQKALMDAEGQADREPNLYGAYPSTDIMGGYDCPYPSASWPYGPTY